jgi:hypothetical protein
MVTFYNPHVDDFLSEPLQFRLLKRRALKKYGFMFDEARASGRSVSVLIDGTASGLIPETLFHRLPHWLRLLLTGVEYRLWRRINNFGSEVQRVEIPNAPIDDVLIAFSYKAATGRFGLREATLQRYRAVVFHLSHYFLATAEKAANIQRLPNAYLAGDSDISGNPYFCHYFGWYSKRFLILSFPVGKRFVNQQPWLSRDPRAVATGSFHDLRLEHPARKYADFMTTTEVTTYHPVRLAIYEAADRLTAWVHCKISPYRQYGQSRFSRMLAHFRVTQKKYFSINIVDLYNQHRYAVVGEELSGFPALGAIEAMACGSILVAQPEYYAGLGLTPWIHFVPYDGDVNSLPKTLMHLDVNQGCAISKAGVNYVANNFTPKIIYHRWNKVICDL